MPGKEWNSHGTAKKAGSMWGGHSSTRAAVQTHHHPWEGAGLRSKRLWEEAGEKCASHQ